MAQFFALLKTIREILSAIKGIKAYFDKIYINKLEEEQKKKAEAGRVVTDIIEADQSKPVAGQSDEDLINAHRNRKK